MFDGIRGRDDTENKMKEATKQWHGTQQGKKELKSSYIVQQEVVGIDVVTDLRNKHRNYA